MAQFGGKFKSESQEWTTPQSFYERLHREFAFTFDLAASPENAKCPAFFDVTSNALAHRWRGVCWLNPPYSTIGQWIKKAFVESRLGGCTVVMLIPARTNTRWWHDYCMKAREVRFVSGRVKFGNANHGLPQPLAVVVFSGSTSPTLFSAFSAN